jgi:hypothetical protein
MQHLRAVGRQVVETEALEDAERNKCSDALSVWRQLVNAVDSWAARSAAVINAPADAAAPEIASANSPL